MEGVIILACVVWVGWCAHRQTTKELKDAATSSLDLVTDLLLKWQTEGILD
jgi:hypothetical protein